VRTDSVPNGSVCPGRRVVDGQARCRGLVELRGAQLGQLEKHCGLCEHLAMAVDDPPALGASFCKRKQGTAIGTRRSGASVFDFGPGGEIHVVGMSACAHRAEWPAAQLVGWWICCLTGAPAPTTAGQSASKIDDVDNDLHPHSRNNDGDRPTVWMLAGYTFVSRET